MKNKRSTFMANITERELSHFIVSSFLILLVFPMKNNHILLVIKSLCYKNKENIKISPFHQYHCIHSYNLHQDNTLTHHKR